jgi:hypothetical protein
MDPEPVREMQFVIRRPDAEEQVRGLGGCGRRSPCVQEVQLQILEPEGFLLGWAI